MSPWAQTPFQQRAGPEIQEVSTGIQASPVDPGGSPRCGFCMRTVPEPSWRKPKRRSPTTRAQRAPGCSTSMTQPCHGPSPTLQRRGTARGTSRPVGPAKLAAGLNSPAQAAAAAHSATSPGAVRQRFRQRRDGLRSRDTAEEQGAAFKLVSCAVVGPPSCQDLTNLQLFRCPFSALAFRFRSGHRCLIRLEKPPGPLPLDWG